MRCPYCSSSDNGVVDSRETDDRRAIRRRRRCNACDRRFTTYERAEELTLLLVKKDGRREPFRREKLIAGMRFAFQKRPVAAAKIDVAAADIEARAHDLGEREVASVWVGEQVMEALRSLDEIAYVRFASVYRSFRDVEEFARELDNLRSRLGETSEAESTSNPVASPPSSDPRRETPA